MILLDTSVLIDSLSGPKRSAAALREAIVRGERIEVPSLVLYEWLRGPRVPEELSAQEALFPSGTTVNFGPEEASLAAELYRAVPRPRQGSQYLIRRHLPRSGLEKRERRRTGRTCTTGCGPGKSRRASLRMVLRYALGIIGSNGVRRSLAST